MATKRDGFHDLFAQIPDLIWDALFADAQQQGRSATAQLTQILKRHYGIEDVPPPKKRGPKPKRRGKMPP